MVQCGRSNGEHGIDEHRKWGDWPVRRAWTKHYLRCLKALASPKYGDPCFMRVKFVHFDGQGIAIHQIPRVPLQLSADIGNEPRRPVQPEGLVPAECDPEQTVKSNEVIHVCVRNEDVIGAKEMGGTEKVLLPQIEEQRSARPFYFNIEPGIAERVVDEVAGKGRRHADCGEGCTAICCVLVDKMLNVAPWVKSRS